MYLEEELVWDEKIGNEAEFIEIPFRILKD